MLRMNVRYKELMGKDHADGMDRQVLGAICAVAGKVTSDTKIRSGIRMAKTPGKIPDTVGGIKKKVHHITND